ncbi:ATP-dependent transcription regulator LuxR [Caballeronia fortuita]|uniref:ATP-dependent transcription regulator LuxR n=1 Tax=Caballeronia fortuita TaxID=1777138 RepID=A0A158C754_9BURK|nr:LuxR C-terminal-related transcriptional regulator [Caballeronia fortuita]SAK78175.1 ATP-dependent transcription regulator LuxR [Caballeronia fortuita]
MNETIFLRIPDHADDRAGPSSAPADRACGSPRVSTRIVGRERLIGQLVESRRKRCIVMQGPAGYGKTTALIAWREALYPLAFQVAWLTLSEEIDDLARFLDALAASLAQVDPAIAGDAALLGGRGMDDEAIERTIIALVRGIASRQGDLVLVLDDLHRLTDPRCHQSLQWLLDYAPSNLHVALASRGAIPLSVGRIRDEGLLLELDMRDLRFSVAESHAFLKSQLREISPRDARRMHEMTDGWIAGLQLLVVSAKRGNVAPKHLVPDGAFTSAPLLGIHSFAEYFSREVLSRLAANECELLVRMAVCERLCAPLCVALIGAEDRPADVLRLLARLESDNLFLAPAGHDAHHAWYRLNPLFRETLLERFRARSEAQRRQVHRDAWQWFRAHDHVDEAVRHAVLAGECAAAANLVAHVAHGLQARGELRRIVALMRLLPPAEIQARVGLRLWMIHLHLYNREFDACACALERLRADLAPDDTLSHYRLMLLQGALAVQRDDLDAACALLPRLHALPDDAPGVTIGARNNLLSWIHTLRGEYEDARRSQAERAPLLADGTPLTGTPAGVLSGRALVGFGHLLEGDLLRTERVCRDVLHEAEPRRGAAAEASALATALLGEVLYESGDADQARRLLEERLDVIERVSFPDAVTSVLTVLSASHWLAGHRLDAIACLDRLEDYAARHELRRALAYCGGQRVRRDLQSGQFDAAHAGLARLDELIARAGSRAHEADLRFVAQLAHIDWRLAHEDFDAAAHALTPLIALCRERGWQRRAVSLDVRKAVTAHYRGDAANARKLMLEAVRHGHRLRLVRTLLDAHPAALELTSRVCEENQQDGVLQFYADRLRDAHACATAKRATTPGTAGARSVDSKASDILSVRESKVLSLLAQALPNKKIARTMGISPETVKWHLKNIYGKLGVSSRDEAVARSRDLALSDGA